MPPRKTKADTKNSRPAPAPPAAPPPPPPPAPEIDGADESLTSLAGPLARARRTLGSRGPPEEFLRGKELNEERRPRIMEKAGNDAEILRECIIGFVEDEDDPKQVSEVSNVSVKDRESKEIAALAAGAADSNAIIPISKESRADFVWVACSRERRRDTRKMYTWNVDEIRPVKNYRLREDNTCDVCGACCTEELYEFRCYQRRKAQEALGVENGRRLLHPFISYISKSCGKGLLGVQSEASVFLEQLSSIIASENAEDRLREIWGSANRQQKLLIQDKLRYLAKSQEGESQRAAEIKKAEIIYGSISQTADDVFRAVAKSFAPELKARDFAAVALRGIGDDPQEGYLGKCIKARLEKQPLPVVPTPWDKQEVVESLQLLVQAVPLKVTLQDTLREPLEFASATGTPITEIDLVYLAGVMELHAKGDQQVDKSISQELKGFMKDGLEETADHFRGVVQLGQRHGVSRMEENSKIVIPDVPHITFDHIREGLEGITWPACFSRGNVKPTGALYIEAFPMGIVLNYCAGLMCSVTLRIWPRLALLLNDFVRQVRPDFKYTTIQLNKNYGAKMHVDSNNHGPSIITGVGDYQDGELWVYDETGDTEMEVAEPMRGFPEFKTGQKLRGWCYDIKNKWLEFDGNRPHAVRKFAGTRMSIVFFTRKKWLSMNREARNRLLELRFPVPGEDYEKRCTDRTQDPMVKRMKLASGHAGAQEEEPEDEPDEEERMDAELRGDQEKIPHISWPQRFQRHLGVTWGDLSVGRALALTTCCTGPAPLVALQDLIPAGCLQVRACTETNPVALKLVKQNCLAERLFTDVESAPAGHGHCDVAHQEIQVGNKLENLDLHIGCFTLAPFLNRDSMRQKSTCFDDPHAQPFRQQFLHLQRWRPTLALLFIPDYPDLTSRQRNSAMNFILDGKNPKDQSAWGLRHLEHYGVHCCEVPLGEYGAPLARSSALIALVRADRGKQHAEKLAQAVTRVMRTLAGKLEHTSLQDVLWQDDDKRLKEAKKDWKKPGKQREKKKQEAQTALKKLMAERKELNLKETEYPYRDYLWGHDKFGPKFVDKEWFPHATDYDKFTLDIIFERAKRSGMDLDNLVVDYSKTIKDRAWRDDGLLTGPGLHYAFGRHRPLTGQEELLCSGLPVGPRFFMRGVRDTELRNEHAMMAAAPAPVSAFGAAIVAALGVVDLGSGRHLRAQQARLQELLEEAKALSDDPLVRALTSSEGSHNAASFAEQLADQDGAQFEGRAVALLNLVNHGSFGAEESNKPAREETRRVLQTLAKVAEMEAVDDRAEPPPQVQKIDDRDNPRDWNIRLRKIRHAYPRVDLLMSWIRDSAEDPGSDTARGIVVEGLNKIKDVVSKRDRSAPIPHEIMAGKTELKELIKSAGFEIHARPFFEFLEETVVQEALSTRNKDYSISSASEVYGSMEKYIQEVVRPLQSWPVRKTFLEHLVEAPEAGRKDFFAEGGHEEIDHFLAQAPQKIDQSWPTAKQVLQKLEKVCPQALMPRLHQVAQQLSDKEKRKMVTRIEERMFTQVIKMLQEFLTSKGEMAALDAFKLTDGDLGDRFQLTAELLDSLGPHLNSMWDAERVSKMKAADVALRLQGCKAEISSIQMRRQSFDSATFAQTLAQQLTAAEDRLITETQKLMDDHQKRKAAEEQKEEEEKVRKEQEELLSKQREQLELQAKVSKEKAELAARRILQLVEDEGNDYIHLASQTMEGFGELQAEMSTLVSSVQSAPEMLALPPEVSDARRLAIAAAKHFTEGPARQNQAKWWLHKKKFGYCIPLLEKRGFLDRLLQLRASGTACLAEFGLPKWCRESLQIQLQNEREEQISRFLMLFDTPPGWNRRSSRTCLFEYFMDPTGTEVKFEWPVKPVAPEVPKLPDGPVPEAKGEPQADGAVYLDFNAVGAVYCQLCDEGSDTHLNDAAHQEARGAWEQLWKVLEEVLQELHAECGKTLDEEVPGIELIWHFELWRRLRVKPSGLVKGPRVEAIFWHRVVKPRTATETSTAAAVAGTLEAMLRAARLQEPAPELKVPTPGVDFPYFPAPRESTTGITPDSAPEVVDGLTMGDLLAEGIRYNGKTWTCGYCDLQDIGDVARHIHPHFQLGKRHRMNRATTMECIQLLKKEGWKLRHEGISISKKEFYCTYCARTGNWFELFSNGHLATNYHKNKRPDRIPQDPLESELKAWSDVFAKADAELEAEEGNVEDPRPKMPQPGVATASPMTPAAAALAAAPASPLPAAPSPPEPLAEEEVLLPDLPRPGVDLPCYIPTLQEARAHDRVLEGVKSLEALSDGELLLAGIERTKGGQGFEPGYWCGWCEYKPENLDSHLRNTKSGAKHRKDRDYCLQILENLFKDGWRFYYHGIRFEGRPQASGFNRWYICETCGKEEAWYKAFEHLDENRHKKAMRYATNLPKQPPDGPSEEERGAWEKMIRASMGVSRASPGEPAALAPGVTLLETPRRRPKNEVAPGRNAAPSQAVEGSTPKRAKVVSAPAEATPAVAQAAVEAPVLPQQPEPAAAPSVPVKVPEGLQWETEKPSADELESMAQKAGQKYYPMLKAPLHWGKDAKKQGFFIYCTACEKWVGWALLKFNNTGGTHNAMVDPDGGCAHYLPRIKDQIKNHIKTW